MTDLRKAAEMALDALEDSMYPQKKQFDAIVRLKQALAQPEQDRELTQQAVWALKDLISAYPETSCIETRISAQKVIATLEAELARPDHPLDKKADNARDLGLDYGPEHQIKYVAYGLRADENGKLSIGELPKREWVGLTQDEIEEIYTGNTRDNGMCNGLSIAFEVQNKLREKNNAV
jgi:hypothetical protein